MSLPGVESILSYARPSIALSVVAVDSSLPQAGEIVAELRIALDEAIHLPPDANPVALSRAVPTALVARQELSAKVASLIQQADHADNWQRLESLGAPEKLSRLDTHRLPLVHLVLHEDSLLDTAERAQVSQQLQGIARLATCLCVTFVGGANKSVHSEVDVDTIPRWLKAFEFSPCRTSVWWINQRLDSGRTLEDREYAIALASMITSDIVHFDPTNDRVLSFETGSGQCTFGTWGLRAVVYSPIRLARDGKLGTTEEALAATLLKSSQSKVELGIKQLPSCPAILAEVMGESGNGHAKLLIDASASAGGAGRLSATHGSPSILGTDHREETPFQATVSMGGDQFRQKFDDIPRHLWQEAILEWDFFHQQEAVDVWLAPLPAKFEAVADRISKQISSQIERLIRAGHPADQLAKACESLREGLSTTWRVAVQTGKTRNLQQSQNALQAALASIPHWPTLLGRCGLLVAVQLWILWTLVAGVAPWKGWLITATALAVLATIGQGLWTWLIAWKRVQDARDRAVEDIERRCELLACQRLGNGLSLVTSRVIEEVGQLGKELLVFHQTIAETSVAPEPFENDRALDSKVIAGLPNAQQTQHEFERFKLETFANPQSQLVQNIQEAAAQLFFDRLKTADVRGTDLVDAVQDLVHKALLAFFDRLAMVHFVDLNRPAIDPLGNPELAWLLKEIQADRYFLEGRLVQQAALSATTVRQHLILPGSLNFARIENESICNRRGGMKGTAIRLFRVVLAESSGKQERDPS